MLRTFKELIPADVAANVANAGNIWDLSDEQYLTYLVNRIADLQGYEVELDAAIAATTGYDDPSWYQLSTAKLSLVQLIKMDRQELEAQRSRLAAAHTSEVQHV